MKMNKIAKIISTNIEDESYNFNKGIIVFGVCLRIYESTRYWKIEKFEAYEYKYEPNAYRIGYYNYVKLNEPIKSSHIDTVFKQPNCFIIIFCLEENNIPNVKNTILDFALKELDEMRQNCNNSKKMLETLRGK